MHVSTALHANNDFYTLFTMLNRLIVVDDLFALSACAQHAYGTRVYSGLTCDGVRNCVCVVTMYRVCVFHVDGVDVSVMHDIVLRSVSVRIGKSGCIVFGGVYIYIYIYIYISNMLKLVTDYDMKTPAEGLMTVNDSSWGHDPETAQLEYIKRFDTMQKIRKAVKIAPPQCAQLFFTQRSSHPATSAPRSKHLCGAN
jgi:hypothetical protein